MILKSLFFLALMALLCWQPVFAREALYKEINISDAAQLAKSKPGSLVIVDVRTPAEYAEGHLPGAKNIDFFGPRFEDEISKLPKDKPVLVYCRSGKRAAGAAEMMTGMGMDKVLHMSQGYDDWRKAGYPLEK